MVKQSSLFGPKKLPMTNTLAYLNKRLMSNNLAYYVQKTSDDKHSSLFGPKVSTVDKRFTTPTPIS
jgi:hypothetical protein